MLFRTIDQASLASWTEKPATDEISKLVIHLDQSGMDAEQAFRPAIAVSLYKDKAPMYNYGKVAWRATLHGTTGKQRRSPHAFVY